MSFLFGGAPQPETPPAQDTSALQAQRAKEAEEAATKERVDRARTGGMYSTLGPNGYMGVTGQQSSQTLGAA